MEKETQLFIAFWINAGGGWVYRIDKRTHHTLKHIHIKRKKDLKGEYSWNIDGSRHDKHKFPANEKMIKRAKEIAAEKLRVPIHTLRFITTLPTRPFEILIIDDCEIVIYKKSLLQAAPSLLFATDQWIIIVGIGENYENA